MNVLQLHFDVNDPRNRSKRISIAVGLLRVPDSSTLVPRLFAMLFWYHGKRHSNKQRSIAYCSEHRWTLSRRFRKVRIVYSGLNEVCMHPCLDWGAKQFEVDSAADVTSIDKGKETALFYAAKHGLLPLNLTDWLLTANFSATGP